MHSQANKQLLSGFFFPGKNTTASQPSNIYPDLGQAEILIENTLEIISQKKPTIFLVALRTNFEKCFNAPHHVSTPMAWLTCIRNHQPRGTIFLDAQLI
jgi:hypothetical protein